MLILLVESTNNIHDRNLHIASSNLFHFHHHCLPEKRHFQLSLFLSRQFKTLANLSSSDTFPFTPYYLSLTRHPRFSLFSALCLSLEVWRRISHLYKVPWLNKVEFVVYCWTKSWSVSRQSRPYLFPQSNLWWRQRYWQYRNILKCSVHQLF